MLAAFAASLGDLAGPALLRWPGVLIPAFVAAGRAGPAAGRPAAPGPVVGLGVAGAGPGGGLRPAVRGGRTSPARSWSGHEGARWRGAVGWSLALALAVLARLRQPRGRPPPGRRPRRRRRQLRPGARRPAEQDRRDQGPRPDRPLRPGPVGLALGPGSEVELEPEPEQVAGQLRGRRAGSRPGCRRRRAASRSRSWRTCSDTS